METLLRDIRYALTSASRARGFAVASVLTLALGIGATTAMFAVIDGVLLRPLPYPSADRLVRIFEEHEGAVAPLSDHLLTSRTFRAWRDGESRTLAGLGGYRPQEYTVSMGDEAARMTGAAVTGEMFSVLGAVPAAGRFFSTGEFEAGAVPPVVLSDTVWRQRFGASPSATGQTLRIDGRPHVVVGVAPPGFFLPDRHAQLWTLFVPAPASGRWQGRNASTMYAIGRLRTGVTAAQAASEGTAIARGLGSPPPEVNLLFGGDGPTAIRARPVAAELTDGVRPALLAAMAGVTLVLLVACGNVANLLLSRGISREREFWVRVALGASRGRVIRQLLTEALVLALAGGGLGVALSWTAITATPAVAPASFPRLDDISLDAQVVAFACAVSVLTVLVSGLVPAVRAVRDRGRRIPTRRVRESLLVAEAALAVILLVGAMLLARSFARLLHVDGGYEPRGVLTASIHLPGSSGSPERSRQVLEAVLNRLRAVPQLTAAGGGNMMPFGPSTSIAGFEMPSPKTGSPMMAQAREYAVSPGYAEALGLRVRQGRAFIPSDESAATSNVLVNEEFARLYLAEGRNVGKLFPTGLGSSGKAAQVIGVVQNVLKDGLATRPQPEIYLTLQSGMPMREINLVVRTDGSPAALAPAVRQIVHEVDASAAIANLRPLSDVIADSVAQPRFTAAMLGAFACTAVTLAGVGIYGVLTVGLARRQREFGVRAALGANRRDLMRLVVSNGIGLTAAGLGIGLGAAAVLSRLMTGLLFGVQPLDALSFAGAAAVLLVVAMAACVPPALKAAAISPADLLKSE